jgi:hypothetical protein
MDMRCEEIRDQLVDLLYDETGMPAAGPELRAHVQSCSACRKELEGLQQVRVALRAWKDEAPIRPVALPKSPAKAPLFQFRTRALVRYGAIAAMITLAFLAGLHYNWRLSGYTNDQVQVLVEKAQHDTEARMREIIKQAQYDTEARMAERQNVGFQRLLEAVENEQGYMYARLTRSQADRVRQ